MDGLGRGEGRSEFAPPDSVEYEDRFAATPCAGCLSDWEVRFDDGSFVTCCSRCGRHGPMAPSAYEAIMAWHAGMGERALSMGRQVAIIALMLIVLGAVLTLLGVLAGG